MSQTPSIHYQFQPAQNPKTAQPKTLLFIHGLFGDLNNLGMIARPFVDEYHILRVDLRNHGQSFHSDEMNFTLMADDIFKVVEQLGLSQLILVGHSLGGKTAMTFAHHYPDYVEKLVVIDIAPVIYTQNRHRDIFAGLFRVRDAKPANRQQARELMFAELHDEGVTQFMLKSFDPTAPEYFKFNLSGLRANYDILMGWENVSVQTPTLFIKGSLSDYLQQSYTKDVLAQLPNSKLFVVNNASHWVHAEKPDSVIRAIQEFL